MRSQTNYLHYQQLIDTDRGGHYPRLRENGLKPTKNNSIFDIGRGALAIAVIISNQLVIVKYKYFMISVAAVDLSGL